MSYRFSGLDVVIGVGLCAIVMGALLVVFATSGTFLAAAPPSALDAMGSHRIAGMEWVQPALGQAIVERAALQRASDRVTAAVTSEWGQAVAAHRRLQAMGGNPFGEIMRQAAMMPENHAARVQAVMGHSIVNFTRRGVRSGVLSGDMMSSEFNRRMIGRTEATGHRLHGEFLMSWQPLLGRSIVETGREHWDQMASIQARLGTAVVHMAQAKLGLEDAWASNQYQLGTLLAAVDRAGIGVGAEPVMVAAGGISPPASVEAAGKMTGIPIGYFIVALCGVTVLFFTGLMVSAWSREAKAQAEMRRERERWVYRLAS